MMKATQNSERRTQKQPAGWRFTNGEIATLIDALREAEVFKQSIIDSELPPKSVPFTEWAEEDRTHATLLRQSIERYRKLRRMFERAERAA